MSMFKVNSCQYWWRRSFITNARKERLFKTVQLDGRIGQTTRLTLYWLRMGAMMPRWSSTNPETLYFFSPDHALEAKATIEEEFGENPYRFLVRGIYDDALSAKLIACI